MSTVLKQLGIKSVNVRIFSLCLFHHCLVGIVDLYLFQIETTKIELQDVKRELERERVKVYNIMNL